MLKKKLLIYKKKKKKKTTQNNFFFFLWIFLIHFRRHTLKLNQKKKISKNQKSKNQNQKSKIKKIILFIYFIIIIIYLFLFSYFSNGQSQFPQFDVVSCHFSPRGAAEQRRARAVGVSLSRAVLPLSLDACRSGAHGAAALAPDHAAGGFTHASIIKSTWFIR